MIEPLYEAHETDEPVDLEQPVDAAIARHLLIELQVNARKAEKLKATLAAVAGEYQARLQALADREAAIRQSLHNYVTANGKVSFPDVGSAYLTQPGPRITVTDAEALLAWARKNAPQIVETSYRVPASDLKDYLKETGELPAGVEFETPEPSLGVRRS